MVRKTPVRHIVKQYIRKGHPVHSYNRGLGTKEYPHPNPVNPNAPWYYRPDDNSLNSELQELGSGVSVDIGGRYGYSALDIFKDGRMQDTLIAGLTKKKAEALIDIIYRYVHEKHRFPTEKVEIVPGGRYGYTALDLYRNGHMRDTLITHLTRKEADNFVWAVHKALSEIKHEGKVREID